MGNETPFCGVFHSSYDCSGIARKMLEHPLNIQKIRWRCAVKIALLVLVCACRGCAERGLNVVGKTGNGTPCEGVSLTL